MTSNAKLVKRTPGQFRQWKLEMQFTLSAQGLPRELQFSILEYLMEPWEINSMIIGLSIAEIKKSEYLSRKNFKNRLIKLLSECDFTRFFELCDILYVTKCHTMIHSRLEWIVNIYNEDNSNFEHFQYITKNDYLKYTLEKERNIKNKYGLISTLLSHPESHFTWEMCCKTGLMKKTPHLFNLEYN